MTAWRRSKHGPALPLKASTVSERNSMPATVRQGSS